MAQFMTVKEYSVKMQHKFNAVEEINTETLNDLMVKTSCVSNQSVFFLAEWNAGSVHFESKCSSIILTGFTHPQN